MSDITNRPKPGSSAARAEKIVQEQLQAKEAERVQKEKERKETRRFWITASIGIVGAVASIVAAVASIISCFS